MRPALLALALVACTTTVPAPTPSAPPTAEPTTTAVSVPTLTPVPTPSPIPPIARPIPSGLDAFELVPVRSLDGARLWLIDPLQRRTPELIAKWSPPFEVGSAFSASEDRRLVVLSAISARGNAALYLIETQTGTIRSLLEDPSADLLGPVFDHSGTAVAYTRRNRPPADPVDDGIWLKPVPAGAPRRLTGGGGQMQPLAWSAGDSWLAYTPDGFPHTAVSPQIHVIAPDGTRSMQTGLSGGVSWRPTGTSATTLTITSSFIPGRGGSPGIRSYDVATGQVSVLYEPRSPETWLGRARWHRDGLRFVFTEGTGREGESEVVVVRNDGKVERLHKGLGIFDLFWSADRLLALIGGDEAAWRILDVANGRSTPICLRSDDPLRCV